MSKKNKESLIEENVHENAMRKSQTHRIDLESFNTRTQTTELMFEVAKRQRLVKDARPRRLEHFTERTMTI